MVDFDKIEKEEAQFRKLWQEFWKTPKGKKHLELAKKAGEFQRKLGQYLDRAREAREDHHGE